MQLKIKGSKAVRVALVWLKKLLRLLLGRKGSILTKLLTINKIQAEVLAMMRLILNLRMSMKINTITIAKRH